MIRGISAGIWYYPSNHCFNKFSGDIIVGIVLFCTCPDKFECEFYQQLYQLRFFSLFFVVTLAQILNDKNDYSLTGMSV